LADGGTLFLDEIGEIPLDLQSKLLRVIQDGAFEAVGEDRTQVVDVRLIAATNRDLESHVRAGRFREDLFYRLNVFPIRIPPLRGRLEDVPLLAEHFLGMACRRMGRRPISLSDADRRKLMSYSWPGNVRELQNVMERTAILSIQGKPRLELPNSNQVESLPASLVPGSPGGEAGSYDDLYLMERELVARALEASEGKVSGANGAARRLGVKPTTLAYRMKKLGLK